MKTKKSRRFAESRPVCVDLKSLGAFGPRDLSGVKPPFLVFNLYLYLENIKVYEMR